MELVYNSTIDQNVVVSFGEMLIDQKVGDDEFGHMLAGKLRENGVTDAGVVFDGAAHTPLAFVTLMADGDRDFVFYLHHSADMLLTESELNLDLLRRAAIFHYGSISLNLEPCRTSSKSHGSCKGSRGAALLRPEPPTSPMAVGKESDNEHLGSSRHHKDQRRRATVSDRRQRQSREHGMHSLIN